MLSCAFRVGTYPRDGEILVKVAAAGVSRPDVMQRMGLYPPSAGRTGHSGPRLPAVWRSTPASSDGKPAIA